MFTAPQSNIRIEGFPSGLGEQGNIAKISKGTENMSPFFGNRGTKLHKLEDKNIVSKLIRRGTNYENVWEHGNIGQFWKRTGLSRTPPGRASESIQSILLGENDKMLLKEKLKSIKYTHLQRFMKRNS